MGIQIVGSDGNTIFEVDPLFKAGRVSLRPGPITTWSSFGVATGILSALTLGATVFSLRNTGSGVIVVRRFAMQWVQTTAFGTPQRLEFALYFARSFSGADSGGMGLAASSGRHRSTFLSPNVDARVAQTTALTVGTRSLDTHALGIAPVWAGAVGATMPQTALISHDAGDHPVILQNQEGLVLMNVVPMGATGAGIAYLQCEFAEAPSY